LWLSYQVPHPQARKQTYSTFCQSFLRENLIQKVLHNSQKILLLSDIKLLLELNLLSTSALKLSIFVPFGGIRSIVISFHAHSGQRRKYTVSFLTCMPGRVIMSYLPPWKPFFLPPFNTRPCFLRNTGPLLVTLGNNIHYIFLSFDGEYYFCS
jgi:hypothetical protein